MVCAKTCMAVPGINAAIATLIVQDILSRELTEDEEDLLNGSQVKRRVPPLIDPMLVGLSRKSCCEDDNLQ